MNPKERMDSCFGIPLGEQRQPVGVTVKNRAEGLPVAGAPELFCGAAILQSTIACPAVTGRSFPLLKCPCLSAKIVPQPYHSQRVTRYPMKSPKVRLKA